jgi:hypothetical protein
MALSTLYKRTWQLSLISFIIAALTGFLYRYGMLYPLPESLGFANIRHAHSHLMLFNWICPPIMAWMVYMITGNENSAVIRSFSICIYTLIGLGFLSYPFFLLYGYQSVAIGSMNLPIAAIISGMIMIYWYRFAYLYFKQRRFAGRSIPHTLFDIALIALIISSLGAWGVSIFQFSSIDSPLVSSAMTHFFLGVFTEGWVIIGVLGIIWSKMDKPALPFHSGWLWIPLLFGSLLVFPYSLNRAIITPEMHITASIGLVLIAASLTLHLYLFFKQNRMTGFMWKIVAGLIVVKILFQIAAVLPLDIWPGEHGLKVLYLHILLLGLVSLVFIEAYHPEQDKLAKSLFATTVLLVLLTLVMITGYWPQALTLQDVYVWVMGAALLPLIPATWLLAASFMKRS